MQWRRRGAVPVSRTRRADKDLARARRPRGPGKARNRLCTGRSGGHCRVARDRGAGERQAGGVLLRLLAADRGFFRNKERYYETREIGSQGWHEGKHDPWTAHRLHPLHPQGGVPRVQERVGRIGSPRGRKDRTASSGYQSDASGVQCLRTGESLSRGQSRYGASRAPETPKSSRVLELAAARDGGKGGNVR